MSLLPIMYDFDNTLRRMEREFFKPSDVFGYSPIQQLRRDFFPSYYKNWENLLSPWEKLLEPTDKLSAAINQLTMNEPTTLSSDKEKFEVNVDVQHFAPEEINVKVIDGDVVIQGKHEEKEDGHGYVSRQFVRRYTLPEGCLPDTVESQLSSDGILTVTAPKVLALPSIGERIVPITHTGPVQKQLGFPDPVGEAKQ